MRIAVQIKNIYGQEAIYPFCEKAKIFAAMLNQKTLTRADIGHIKDLGYEIIVQPTVTSL